MKYNFFDFLIYLYIILTKIFLSKFSTYQLFLNLFPHSTIYQFDFKYITILQTIIFINFLHK